MMRRKPVSELPPLSVGIEGFETRDRCSPVGLKAVLLAYPGEEKENEEYILQKTVY